MNIPMLRDLDNDPGFYVAACGNTDWAGSTLFVSSDGGATYQNLLGLDTAATIGRTLDVLGDFGGGNVPDELNAVTVRLYHGTLSSTNYDGLLAGVQAALIGEEIVYFRDALLNVDGSYTLTGFLRGRRGTEQTMAAHAAADRFVLLAPSMIKRVPAVTADIGIEKSYKAVTTGSTLGSTPAKSFTNAGAALKPYSVVQIGGGRNGDGDFLISWIRRGRMSGEWRNAVDVPLSEASESYQVDIWNDDRSTLLRTLTATGQAAIYSASDQIADDSSIAQVSVSVYQMSEAVGRGHGAHALLPGGATVAEIDPVTLVLSVPVVPPPTGPTPTLFVATTGSDSNPGTLAAPFLTIEYAASVAGPGDVIQIADGVYEGGFATSTDGTSGSPITFIGATRWGVKIKPPASSSSIFAWASHGDYVIIDGIEVDGSVDPLTGTRWHCGIAMYGSRSIARNNHVHHIYRNGTVDGNGGAGILLEGSSGGSNMHALANNVHDVGPTTGGNGYQGIYMTASGEVKNNITYANTGGGIHCWHDVSHVVIANNTTFNNATWGIVYGGGDYVLGSGPCDYMIVANNIVYANGVGIRELGDLGTHNVVCNNLCNANGTNYSMVVTSHTSDVTGDPMFVDYQADGTGSYRLQTGSPAIGVGLAFYAPANDYAGVARGSPPDVGAYEEP